MNKLILALALSLVVSVAFAEDNTTEVQKITIVPPVQNYYEPQYTKPLVTTFPKQQVINVTPPVQSYLSWNAQIIKQK